MTRGLVVLLGTIALVAPASAAAKPGDIYIGDPSNSAVIKMDPRTGDQVPIASGGDLNQTDGLAFGPRGLLYVSDYDAGPSNTGAVFSVNVRSGAVVPLLAGTPLQQPLDLVAGPDRMLYVSDLESGAIFKLNPATRKIAPHSSGKLVTEPLGIDRLPSGAIYTVDREAGVGTAFGVLRIGLAGGGQRRVASGSDPGSNSYGFAVSPNGKFAYVGETAANKDAIFRANLRTGAVTELQTTGAPIDDPTALALAPNRTLYVANFGDQNVLRVNLRSRVASEVGSLASTDGNPEGITVEPPRCGGRLATVVGTTGSDRLRGSRFADVIATLGGSDVVRGGRGKDVICGGAGRDLLLGGPGGDRLLAGPGNDACVGGPGPDRLRSC